MLNWFAKILLTSTAMAPVALIYACFAYQAGDILATFVLIVVCIVLVAVCFWLIRHARKKLGDFEFKVTTVEAADRENTGFLLLYLLPLFTEQFSALNWSAWVPTLLIFAIIVGTGYSYHFNPLLRILGWHFYKVNTNEGVTYVLITKQQIRSVTKTIKVSLLTEYIVIDVGGSEA